MNNTKHPVKKIFIIAGEVSGDVLGAKIMREMPGVSFSGIGGNNMIGAGLKTLFPMSDLSVMGIVEVLEHVRTLKKRIKQTINAICANKPDIVLTIDSPGFAKAVVKGVKSQCGDSNIRFYHVVAPQVWAWREKRAKKYAKIFDKLYAFFDFEVPYFTKYGLETIAVGHPIADGLNEYKKTKSDKKIITFVPGSRMSEVKKLLPVFHQTIDELYDMGYKNYKFVIPTVETTDEYIRNTVKEWRIKPDLIDADKRYNLYASTYIAIVASGTVSAELAIMHIPTIVVYKMNPITTLLAHLLVKVKWVSLVNILMKKAVFPELLGEKTNAKLIIKHIRNLMKTPIRNKMISDLKSADKKWIKSNQSPARTIAQNILSK